MRSRADIAIALCAIASIVAHDIAHVRAGHWFHMFWICNVSALLVGPGILLRSPGMVTAGFSWLVPGTAIWLIDLFINHGYVMPTSYFIHLGGLAAALYGVRRFGTGRWGALPALATLAFALGASRLFLPPAENINAAHKIPAGWGFLGGHFALFAVVCFSLCGVFLTLLWLLARAIHRFRRQHDVGLSVQPYEPNGSQPNAKP